jgi:putative phosphoserine phosphatase/1-acylglycerol-3-phosphate O-acyltransferase
MPVAFLDLDRTLLSRASGRVLSRSLVEAEVLGPDHSIPAEALLFGLYDRFGENLVTMGLTRAGASATKGWSVEKVRQAATLAVPGLLELVAPYALERMAALRASGYRLVLATTTPIDYLEPFAAALGLDDVIATRYEEVDGRYTGRILDGFVWGLGKLQAVKRWCVAEGEELSEAAAYSDSVFDIPLLASVGDPHTVNADLSLLAVAKLRRWPCEQWDRPDGVPALFGLEPYHLLRQLVRPELLPYASFEVSGVEHIPRKGPVILVANHRSYFDVIALALVAARIDRPVRALAKAEIFDAPVVSTVARSLGAIRVDRGADRGAAYEHAIAALDAGEVVILLPQGTIPRGEAFFDPELVGHTGAARLAQASAAPLVPIGLWGTEQVWPRSSRLPLASSVLRRPEVSVTVGEPFAVPAGDPAAATAEIMAAISALLPDGGRWPHRPTDEELAKTHPRSDDEPAS